MPRRVLPLTDVQIRNAKPREKTYSLTDGHGLYIEIMPSGSKLWRMKFPQRGRGDNRLSFGAYPVVTLQEAREKRLSLYFRIGQLLNSSFVVNGPCAVARIIRGGVPSLGASTIHTPSKSGARIMVRCLWSNARIFVMASGRSVANCCQPLSCPQGLSACKNLPSLL